VAAGTTAFDAAGAVSVASESRLVSKMQATQRTPCSGVFACESTAFSAIIGPCRWPTGGIFHALNFKGLNVFFKTRIHPSLNAQKPFKVNKIRSFG